MNKRAKKNVALMSKFGIQILLKFSFLKSGNLQEASG